MTLHDLVAFHLLRNSRGISMRIQSQEKENSIAKLRLGYGSSRPGSMGHQHERCMGQLALVSMAAWAEAMAVPHGARGVAAWAKASAWAIKTPWGPCTCWGNDCPALKRIAPRRLQRPGLTPAYQAAYLSIRIPRC